jgi:glycerol-3-phosphate acyltransferase PlsY
MIVRSVLGVLIGYLLGAIPTGLVVVRIARGRDIRKCYEGSRLPPGVNHAAR